MKSPHGDRHEWLLAIRLRQFGDVIATLSSLQALKKHKPERRIAFVVDPPFHPLLQGLDYIDRLVPPPPRITGVAALGSYRRYVGDIRRLHPTTVLDFHGNSRSAFLTLLSGAPTRVGFDVRIRKRAYTIVEPRADFVDGRLAPRTSIASTAALVRHAGVDPATVATIPPEIPVSRDAIERGRRALQEAGVPAEALAAGALVGLNPGKPYPAKAWPRERFVRLAVALVKRGKQVVLMWGPGEEAEARAVVDAAGDGVTLAPKATLEQLPGVLKQLSMLVTIDSGLKHLAVCMRVPTFTLFGSTDPREWHMGTTADRFLWKGLSCSPCRRLVCPFDAPCMLFGADEVTEGVAALERAIS